MIVQIWEEVYIYWPPNTDDTSRKFNEPSPNKREQGGSVRILQHGQHYKLLNIRNDLISSKSIEGFNKTHCQVLGNIMISFRDDVVWGI